MEKIKDIASYPTKDVLDKNKSDLDDTINKSRARSSKASEEHARFKALYNNSDNSLTNSSIESFSIDEVKEEASECEELNASTSYDKLKIDCDKIKASAKAEREKNFTSTSGVSEAKKAPKTDVCKNLSSRFLGKRTEVNLIDFLCQVAENLCFDTCHTCRELYLINAKFPTIVEVLPKMEHNPYFKLLTWEQAVSCLEQGISMFNYYMELQFPFEVFEYQNYNRLLDNEIINKEKASYFKNEANSEKYSKLNKLNYNSEEKAYPGIYDNDDLSTVNNYLHTRPLSDFDNLVLKLEKCDFDFERIRPSLNFCDLDFVVQTVHNFLGDSGSNSSAAANSSKNLYLKVPTIKELDSILLDSHHIPIAFRRLPHLRNLIRKANLSFIPELSVRVCGTKPNGIVKSCKIFRRDSHNIYYNLDYEANEAKHDVNYVSRVMAINIGLNNLITGYINNQYTFVIPWNYEKFMGLDKDGKVICYSEEELENFYCKAAKKVIEIAVKNDVDMIVFGDNDKNFVTDNESSQITLDDKEKIPFLKRLDFKFIKDIIAINAIDKMIQVQKINYYYPETKDFLDNDTFVPFSLYNIFVCECRDKNNNLELMPSQSLNDDVIDLI